MRIKDLQAVSTAVVAIVVVIIVIIAAAAIGLSLNNSGSKSTTTHKLALLVGGDTTDNGLNAQGVQIAQMVGARYGWTVSISQDVPYSSQGAIMTSYAQEGYDVIWADGNQFIGTTEGIAAQFPNTHFIMTPTYYTDNITSNLVALNANAQATGYYLAGVLCAEMTKTHAVGMILGQWTAQQSFEFYAFQAGVHYNNNTTKVYLTVAGDWGKPQLGADEANAMINTNHVDIIAPIADATGLGAISAAVIAGPNIGVIGTVLDQYVLAPFNMMTSVLLNTSAFIIPVIEHINNGTFSQIGGQIQSMQLGSLGPFHQWAAKIPSSVQSLLNTTAAGIANGTIHVPLTYTPEQPTTP
ncbi:MAG TPA: BMP family ABC transporter substrate-binding protein [Methanomassiliicoccales archaeon]|nr:BMP family ABC transporter substrate-binding protein [Methanomassiliicoccales archaeon]